MWEMRCGYAMCVTEILDFRSKILDFFKHFLCVTSLSFADSAFKKDCYEPQRFAKAIAKVRKEEMSDVWLSEK